MQSTSGDRSAPSGSQAGATVRLRILLLEEESGVADLARDYLVDGDWGRLLGGGSSSESFLSVDVTRVGLFAEAAPFLQQGGFDVALVSLTLPDRPGLGVIRCIENDHPLMPVIVFGPVDDEGLAMQAVHEGAQDFIAKSRINPRRLIRAVSYAIERKRVEAALHTAEEKYHRIFESIVEGIFQTSSDGHYLSANPALARIYGYDSAVDLIAQITDIGSRLYVAGGRREEFVRLMEQHDVVTGFESQVYRKDGSVIWISENVRAIRDRQGRLLYYEGTVEDITERRRAEEGLRNSEALYHSLVETLPQNIFRKDLSERFTFANQRFCLTLGRRLDEILGRTDFDFFPGPLAEKYQQDDRLIMETGKTIEIIEEHQPPGGEKIYVQVVKTPLRDAQGRIIGLQGIFWDITEKIRAEQRERKATAALTANREELRAKNEQLEADLRMAREIQQAMLPQQYPVFPRGVPPSESRLSFEHRYEPTGTVGGDFFSVTSLSDTVAAVFICDVMGHGVRSALITAMVRALVEELKPLALDPGRLLTRLNRDLRSILQQSGNLMFTTAFYLLVDLEAHEYRFASAGHPKPLLLRSSIGGAEPLVEPGSKGGPALGLFEQSVYTTHQRGLESGDQVLLFTDGLYEAETQGGNPYGYDRLISTLRSMDAPGSTALLDLLIARIRQTLAGGQFDDDLCLVEVSVAPDRVPM